MPADLGPVDDRVTATAEVLRRQLALRTAELTALRGEMAALTAQLTGSALTPQVAEWRAKAAEYDALMATKTMHALRIPRAIYGRILARRAPG
jgi:hypothetical protein